MRRFLLLMLLLLVFFVSNSGISTAYEKEIKSLSTAMAEEITKSGKKSIAVVDFTDLQGNVTELGRFIAEEFSVALAGVGKGFEVVDRTHLKTLLQEHKLAITGVIDPTTAKKLGQVIGVEVLVIGTITPFSDYIRLSIKALVTDTAKIIGASSKDIAKTKAIEGLLGRGIDIRQETEINTNTTSKSWLGIDIYPGVFVSNVTIGSPADKAGIKPGDWIVECNGQRIMEWASFKNLISQTPIGSHIKLKVRRGKEEIILEAIIGERPQ